MGGPARETVKVCTKVSNRLRKMSPADMLKSGTVVGSLWGCGEAHISSRRRPDLLVPDFQTKKAEEVVMGTQKVIKRRAEYFPIGV